MKKKLLILGGTFFQIPVIQYAKSAGYEVITCDYLPNNPGHKLADAYYDASTTDFEGVLALAEKLKIDGILAYASDPAALTAAYAGNRLGLPSNPMNAVRILSQKDLYRKHLERFGFHTPKSAGISSKEQMGAVINQLAFPAMIKPVDSSGSKGVAKALSKDDLLQAYDYAMSFSHAKRCIVEEFVEKVGPQIGGEAFVLDGKLISVELGDQRVDAAVNRFVPTGMTFPSCIESSMQQRIYRELQRLIDTTGFQFGGINLEIMLDNHGQLYFMEVGPRTGGNYLPELVSYFANLNYTQCSVELAMGQDIRPFIRTKNAENCYYAYYAVHSDKVGILDSVLFSAEMKTHILESHLFKLPCEPVEAFNGSHCTIGILLLRFSSFRDMHAVLDAIQHHIQVVLNQPKEAACGTAAAKPFG